MDSAFRRFCRLPFFERKLLVQAILFLPITVGALRLVRIKTVMRWMDARPGRQRLGPKRGPEEAQKLTQAARRMLEAASRWGIVRGNCLSKSIVLCRLLQREGLPATLRVGASKNGNQFAAHAWVEVDGLVNTSDEPHGEFIPFNGQAHADWIRER